jgi:hypothetical protein
MLHKCSTIMPLVMYCLHPRGKVSEIYAYAPAPFTRERLRVRIVGAGHGWIGTYADVVPVGASQYALSYRVRKDQLSSISVFVTWEIQ